MVTYKSKVDWWIAALIYLGAPAVSIYTIFETYHSSTTQDFYASLIGFALLVVVLLTIISPITYTLTDGELEVRHGFVRKRVAYSSIRAVTPSLNPLSSPALSLRRLHIECDRRYPLLISPERREDFLADLSARCPHLTFSEDQRALQSA